ncbi:(2Fe-2S)-binding protein [Streptomyces tricolor]|nr:(2Fe-2S)-binding protein [Streptomyces tricolor]
MRGAVVNGVDGIVGECGGGAMCATCHVYVDRGRPVTLPAVSDIEDELLHTTACPRRENSRLSCQLPVTDEIDGLVVDVPGAAGVTRTAPGPGRLRTRRRGRTPSRGSCGRSGR